jgi:hypothetical protein
VVAGGLFGSDCPCEMLHGGVHAELCFSGSREQAPCGWRGRTLSGGHDKWHAEGTGRAALAVAERSAGLTWRVHDGVAQAAHA